MMLDPTNLYNHWLKTVQDTMRVPQSPEQMRREWLKSLKTDELWEVHDDVIKEMRSRT
jgi:hypothetical protein